jgi:hypothetical protein
LRTGPGQVVVYAVVDAAWDSGGTGQKG